MPKIIVASCYIKSTAHKKLGNHIKYIATRKGATLRTILEMRTRDSRTIKLKTPTKIRPGPKIKECR